MVNKEYFGEGKNIEFKREIPSNHEKFLKDIIAFPIVPVDRLFWVLKMRLVSCMELVSRVRSNCRILFQI